MTFRHWRLRGATLIELIASIVIVSVATFGLMLAITSVVSNSANPMIEQQAGAIAEAYLEEASLANFCDPNFLIPGQTCRQQCVASACSTGACGGTGPLKEATRDLYDDICDYRGLTDNGARDRDGNLLSGLGSYNVIVSVVDNAITVGAPVLSANAGEVLQIVVTVSHAAMTNAIVLSTYRANAR